MLFRRRKPHMRQPPQIPGRPPGWLQRTTDPRCLIEGHKPVHDDKLRVTRCERCGLGLALDEDEMRR